MRRDGWVSGMVWAGLTAAACLAFAAGGRDDSRAAAPGHEAGACGVCGAHQPSRGPALPYELGDDNIRFIPPVARAGDETEDGD